MFSTEMFSPRMHSPRVLGMVYNVYTLIIFQKAIHLSYAAYYFIG